MERKQCEFGDGLDPSLSGRPPLCLLSVCLLHLTKAAPAPWLWLSAGFGAVGALLGSVKPPLLPLFINIRAKYRLFKLAVAVQILIAGFISTIRGAGRRARVCSWGSSPYTGIGQLSV